MSVTGQLHFSRIDDHQFGVALGGPFDRHGNYVVFFGNVGVEHQDTTRILKIPDRIGGRGVAQGVLQGFDQLRLHIRSLVHVIGVHNHPGEFLAQVVLFVGALGRSKQGKRVAGILGQSGRYQVQGIFPSGLFQYSVAADQRFAQPIRAVDVLQAEFAFETGLTPVSRCVEVWYGPNETARGVNLQVELAANGTMGTDGALNSGCFLPLMVPFHQSAHRANIYASAAKLTPRLQQRRPERRPHQRGAAPLRETDGVVAPQLLAGPDATAAYDAQVVITVVEGVGDVQGNLAVLVIQG